LISTDLEIEFIAYSVYYTEEALIHQLFDEVNRPLPRLLEMKKDLFDAIAYQQVSGNFVALVKAPLSDSSTLDPSKPIVVCERVEKPGNLGAILRTCDALGVEQVLCADTQIDLYNPNVIRNSRGAVFSVNCQMVQNASCSEFLERSMYNIYQAALTDDAVDVNDIDLHSTHPWALVFGSESKGLSDYWLQRSDHRVVIPMKGKVDSLNLSVTVALLMQRFLS